MRLVQSHRAVQLDMALNETRQASAACAQIMQAQNIGMRENDLFDFIARGIFQLAVHQLVGGGGKNFPSAFRQKSGHKNPQDGVSIDKAQRPR